jgi:hypothetical protein
MNPLSLTRLSAALAVTLVLSACGKDEPPPASPSVIDGRAAAPKPAAEPAAEPKEIQRVSYRCADGRELLLRFHEDQRVRVELDHETHVLRPVTVDGGTLFLGDYLNVKVNGERATASRNGIVLLANCQVQLDANPSGAVP